MNTVQNNKAKFFSVQTITKIAILSAIAVLLTFFEVPLWFVPGFYKVDFSEVIVALGGFALGPVAAIIIEAIKIVLFFFLHGTTTGGVGEIANFAMGLAFVLPATIIYRRNKSYKTAIIGLIVGTIAMSIVGSVLNAYILLPLYAKIFGWDLSKLIAMGTTVNPAISNLQTFILLGVAPFNLFKGGASSILVVLLFKRISPILEKKF